MRFRLAPLVLALLFAGTSTTLAGEPPCTPAPPEYSSYAPPEGCTCLPEWTYAGVTTCGGQCASPDGDPNPWCYTTASCLGNNWAYCSPPEEEPCTPVPDQYADFAPPAGCTCQAEWTYAGVKTCGGQCANPENDLDGAWCYTTASCLGNSWAYCRSGPTETPCTPVPAKYANLVPQSGCTCRSEWTYGGIKTCGGRCANPDNDPNGAWCSTTASCAGKTWSYCHTPSPGTTPAPAYPTHIEVMMVVDRALQLDLGGDGLSFAHDIANRVDEIYGQLDANIYLNKTFVFADGDPWLASSTLDTLLSRVTDWASKQSTATTPRDVVVLLTGLDLSGSASSLSWLGTACSPYAVAVVEASGSVEFVAASVAHELGHTFGASHDGVGNVCPSSGFLMTAVVDTDSPATTFSTCSRDRVRQTFQNPESCMRNVPYAQPECEGGSCPFDLCYGDDAVSCPSSSCSTGPGVCDAMTGECLPGAERTTSPELVQPALDAQCAAAWEGYSGTWVAGDRSGGQGTCGSGCGELRCTNTEWSSYCYTYVCPSGYTCTIQGETIQGPATREICNCLDTSQGQGASTAQKVEECTPCVGDDGSAGFCTNGECVATGTEDVPSSAGKLSLSDSETRGERLVFSANPVIDFPRANGATDPRRAEPQVELFSAAGEEASLSLPSSGWFLNSKGTVYKFLNRNAPDTFSVVRSAILKKTKRGVVLKLKAMSKGLPLDAASGGVGVRFSLGGLRICALFNEATVKTDTIDEFNAARALAGDLKDCSPSSLRAQPR